MPEVPVGEDEFVELDEEGNPQQASAGAGGRRRASRCPRWPQAAAATQGAGHGDPGSGRRSRRT